MQATSHLIPLHPQCRVFCTASDSYANILYPHRHAACELTLIIEGRHALHLPDEQLELEPGDAVLLFSDVPHSRSLLSPGRHLTLAFDALELARLSEYLEYDFSACHVWRCHLSADEAAAFSRDIERIHLHCAISPDRVKTQLRSLLAAFWKHAYHAPDASPRESAPWLAHLMEYMRQPANLRSGLSALLNLTPYTHAYLCREFRRLLGCTPTAYVNSLRIDYAHHLLESTSMSIADICYEVGFDSVSYFYQLFRSKYGMSPARYRKLRFISHPAAPLEQRNSVF